MSWWGWIIFFWLLGAISSYFVIAIVAHNGIIAFKKRYHFRPITGHWALPDWHTIGVMLIPGMGYVISLSTCAHWDEQIESTVETLETLNDIHERKTTQEEFGDDQNNFDDDL